MPFNPALPVELTEADAAQMRDQFNGLKALIDDVAANLAGGLAANAAASASSANAAFPFDQALGDGQMEAFRLAFNQLVASLQRGGGGLPDQPVVTITGFNTPTQTGHAPTAGATNYRWFLRTTTPGWYAQIGDGPADFIDMTGLNGSENFLICVASNGSGDAPASVAVQFAGGV